MAATGVAHNWLPAPRLEARSSSEPQLSRLPPGLTVDELPRYRRRRPPTHLCPQDNLRPPPPSDASFKAVKSEYRRRFLSYPLQACTEQASQYVCHGSPARAPLLRRRTSLRAEGELLVKESELRARFKRLQGAQRAELARRPTTLRMEGEMETRTEHVERFCEPGSGARRPELSKRRTQLQLEGALARDTESRASFAPPAPPAERPPLRRRATNLRLDEPQQQPQPLPSSEYRALFADFPQRDPPVRRRPPQGNLAPGPGEMEKQVTEKRAHFVDWTGVAERPRPHRRSSSLKLEMEAGGGGGAVLPEYRERFVEFPAVARPAAATRALAQSLRLEGDLQTETEKSAQFVDHYSPVARRRQRPPSGGDADAAGTTGALPPLAAAAQRPAAGKRTEDQATRDQQEERRLQRLQEQRRQRQLEEEQREQQARLIQLQRELRARPPPAAAHPDLEPVFPATAPGFRDRDRDREREQAALSRGTSLDSPAARRRAQRRASQASAGTGAAPAAATPPTPRKAPASPTRTPPTPRKVRARHQHDKSPPHTPKKSIPKKAPATPRVGSPSPSAGSGRRRPASASPQRLQQQQQQAEQQGKAARPADTQLEDAEEAAANHQPAPLPQPQQLLALPDREEKPAEPVPAAAPQPAPAPAPAPESKSSSGCIGGTMDRRLTKLRPEPEAAERRRLRPAAPGEVYRAFHVLEKPEKTVTFEMDVRPPTRGRSVSRSGRGSRCSEDRGSCSLDRALSPGYRMHVLNVDDNGNSAPQRRADAAPADADTEGAATAPRPTSPTGRRASSPLPLPRRRGSHIRRDNARHAFIVLDNDNGNNDNGNNSNLNNNNNTSRSGMLDVPRGRGGWVPSWYNAPTSI